MRENIQNRTDLYGEGGETQVPEGLHSARLVQVRQLSSVSGARVGLVFRIEGGPCDGLEIMDAAAPKPAPRGKIADLLRGLGGGSTLEDAKAKIGGLCRILVRHESDRTGKKYSAIAYTMA